VVIAAVRQKRERRHVPWAHHREVAMVERRHGRQPEPLGQSDGRCVHDAQRKVGVGADEVRNPFQIGRRRLKQGEQAGTDVGEECELGAAPPSSLEQHAHLGEHRRRDEERTGIAGEELAAARVMVVPVVDQGHDRPRVDDDHIVEPSGS